MRGFVLQRDEDETGVSGVGIVAQGVEFDDGTVCLHWIASSLRSTVIWPGPDGMAAVEQIHGHGGKTRILQRRV